MPDRSGDPLLICFDGSPAAEHPIMPLAELFGGRTAVVPTVWERCPELTANRPFRGGARGRVEEGSSLAREVGLDAVAGLAMVDDVVWVTIGRAGR